MCTPLTYSIKPTLEEHQKRIYEGVAFLVRWIDFDSKGAGREMPVEREKITKTITDFEVALAEVVRLVYQCQLHNGTASTPANHQRRYIYTELPLIWTPEVRPPLY